MEKTFYDEKSKLHYELAEDGCYYPLIAVTPRKPIGKYGKLRKTYLQEHRPALFGIMLLNDTLSEHLSQVDQEANQRMDALVSTYAKAAGTDNALKRRNQMAWVAMMNNHHACAEEVVFAELIYV